MKTLLTIVLALMLIGCQGPEVKKPSVAVEDVPEEEVAEIIIWNQLTPNAWIRYYQDMENMATLGIRYHGVPIVDDYNLFVAISQIEGLNGINPEYYDIILYKGSQYSWGEIERKLIEVLEEFERRKAKKAFRQRGGM